MKIRNVNQTKFLGTNQNEEINISLNKKKLLNEGIISGAFGIYSGVDIFESLKNKPIKNIKNPKLYSIGKGINRFLLVECLFLGYEILSNYIKKNYEK